MTACILYRRTLTRHEFRHEWKVSGLEGSMLGLGIREKNMEMTIEGLGFRGMIFITDNHMEKKNEK